MNGFVNSGDVSLIQQYLSGFRKLTDTQKKLADVSADEKVTRDDVIILQNYLIGTLKQLPYKPVYGDTTLNGTLSGLDGAYCLQYVQGIAKPTGLQRRNADVNLDGRITKDDCDLIGKAVVGLITLPVPPARSSSSVASSVRSSSVPSSRMSSIPSSVSSVPSSVSSSMSSSEKPQSASLFITQLATVHSETAVKNQKNISLLRFEARADISDVLLTSLLFTATGGSANNIYNYTLWVDTDDNGVVDTKLQSGVFAQSNRILFANLSGSGYVVTPQKPVVFEVHGDVAPALSGNSLQLLFATGMESYVKAEQLSNGTALFSVSTNGVCPAISCRIFVQTASATVWKFVSQGDLYVTQSPVMPRPRQLLGGALSDTILHVNFMAQREPIEVTRLVFAAAASSLERLELYKTGETTPFAVATVAGCGSESGPSGAVCAFMPGGQLIIEKGQVQTVLVRARIRTDDQGAVSGEQLRVGLHGLLYPKAVQARGLFSSNNLLTNNGDDTADGEVVIGRSTPGPNTAIGSLENFVVLSKIVSITNADPNANGTAIPTGMSVIGQFKFTAAANANTKNGVNKPTFDYIFFRIDAPNVQLGMFKLYNKADASQQAPCFQYAMPGDFWTRHVVCGNFAQSGVNAAIGSGEDLTLALAATITNPKMNPANPSSLQVSLENFSNPALSNKTTPPSSIGWLDAESNNPQPAEFFWIEYPDSVVRSTLYQG